MKPRENESASAPPASLPHLQNPALQPDATPPPSANHPLDNPIWTALTTTQARLAVGGPLARSFPADIGPLAAISAPTPEAFAALAQNLPPNAAVALFLDAEPPAQSTRPHWKTIHEDALSQMVCDHPVNLARDGRIRPLAHADVPQMIALAELTEPGPFRQRTIDLGSYKGIFSDGALVAMTGERLRPAGFTEVSAVCTHPGHRGKGFARSLMSEVMRGILARNETPFLHVRSSNAAAIALYERLGFALRRGFHLAVLQRASAFGAE